MVDLRQVYVEAGLQEVATHRASGNVIFESSGPPDVSGLELAFTARFGFPAEVFLRSSEQISRVLDAVPWAESDGITEISFLERVPGADAARELEATARAPEVLVVSGREVLFLRNGRSADTVHKESTSMRILGMKMTRRGVSTVREIHDGFPATPPGPRSV